MKSSENNSQSLNKWISESDWTKYVRLSRSRDQINNLTDNTTWDQLKSEMGEEPADLIDILAQVMPVRHSVWWGLMCGALVEGFAVGTPATDCIKSALDWVLDTDETRRLKARAMSDRTDWKIPECLLARAVSWSSGTILPDSVPAFYPAPAGVTGQMISGAVRSFAARNTIHDHRELLWHFIELAEGVASGRFLPEGWERQNLNLSESIPMATDLSSIEIPGHLGFGF